MAPTTTHPLELASAITTRRKELGLSVVDVKKRTGIARSTWSKIEAGERERIANKTLDSINEVLEWEQDEATIIYRFGKYYDGTPVPVLAWLRPVIQEVEGGRVVINLPNDGMANARAELARCVDQLHDDDVLVLLRVAKGMLPPT